MVSINDITNKSGKTILNFVGLSSDEKPIKTFDYEVIRNGSVFLEIDTSEVFMYDEENNEWKKL